MEVKKVLLTAAVVWMMAAYLSGIAVEAKQEDRNDTKVPGHVINISENNTYTNKNSEDRKLKKESRTPELLKDTKVKITNSKLIEMFNETSITPSPFAIGYRGEIFLGRWPLAYNSKETTVNWKYQKINENELNNVNGVKTKKIGYEQIGEKQVQGGLTTQTSHSDQLREMILLEAQKNTDLPLAYQTVIGRGTSHSKAYDVAVDYKGVLEAYAPALKETGEAVFGDVYIQLKGSDKKVMVKNITKQEIGAWIPVENHISFRLIAE
ncbi:YfkD famly protein [Halobacillus halophilus]|uniref:YfkD famly protein n=1 Tax=Halobacillus halophilus TaxID=1570 RepID=UPI001CD5243F|nr:YfkD famly protein [Halobacillus halophilus]MCA1010195.1 YfkD family protein [Halobacillus halophilus]